MNTNSAERENFIVYPITRRKYKLLKALSRWMWNTLSLSLVCLVLGEIFFSAYFILPTVVWAIILGTSFCFLIGINVNNFFSASRSPLRVLVEGNNIHFIGKKEGKTVLQITTEAGFKVAIESIGGGRGPRFIAFYQPNGDVYPFLFNRREILYKKTTTRQTLFALRENLEKIGVNTQDMHFNKLNKELRNFVVALLISSIAFILMEFK